MKKILFLLFVVLFAQNSSHAQQIRIIPEENILQTESINDVSFQQFKSDFLYKEALQKKYSYSSILGSMQFNNATAYILYYGGFAYFTVSSFSYVILEKYPLEPFDTDKNNMIFNYGISVAVMLVGRIMLETSGLTRNNLIPWNVY